jgi:hypothetical protein
LTSTGSSAQSLNRLKDMDVISPHKNN